MLKGVESIVKNGTKVASVVVSIYLWRRTKKEYWCEKRSNRTVLFVVIGKRKVHFHSLKCLHKVELSSSKNTIARVLCHFSVFEPNNNGPISGNHLINCIKNGIDVSWSGNPEWLSSIMWMFGVNALGMRKESRFVKLLQNTCNADSIISNICVFRVTLISKIETLMFEFKTYIFNENLLMVWRFNKNLM